MRKYLFFLLLQMFSMSAFSQTLTAKEWKAIQKSGDYIIGMGMSESMDHARQVAMSDLVGKISSKVESGFTYILGNKNNKESEGKMEKIIRSYSSVTLNNVSEYVDKDHGKFVVYRFIKNSDLRAMFKRRVKMAKNWAKEAAEREKVGKIGDALQNYYWSLALLRSCPDGDLETISQDYNEVNMMIDVRERVKQILENITIKAVSSESEGNNQRLTLNINYKGSPIANLNYKYADGKVSSDIFTAKDGMGEILVPSNVKMKKLKIKAEYEFRDEANIQPELRSVMETLDPVPFRAAMLDVDTRSCVQTRSADYAMAVAEGDIIKPSPGSAGHVMPIQSYTNTMEAIEKGIARKDFSGLEGNFTSEGWDMFNKLINYGDAKLLKSPEVKFIPSEKGMVCRSFPMSFTFKGNKRTFTEDVVFYLNTEGKVYEVAFGLEKRAVDDIMNRGEWSDEARILIIHFLETYKTAYALKRLDYINGIYSKEALIITGSVVKGTGQKELQPAKMTHVKYTRQTKDQYMKNLARCFQSNEYINLHFADNIVRRSNNYPNIYGIQIKQDYFSSTYGDTGYLFLLLDFKNPKDPIIHVRTWQPDDDPNVKDGRIGMADFQL